MSSEEPTHTEQTEQVAVDEPAPVAADDGDEDAAPTVVVPPSAPVVAAPATAPAAASSEFAHAALKKCVSLGDWDLGDWGRAGS